MRLILGLLVLLSATFSFAGNESGGGTMGIVAPFDMQGEAVKYVGEDQTYTYFIRAKNTGSVLETARHRLDHLTINPNADRYLNALDASKSQNDWVEIR